MKMLNRPSVLVLVLLTSLAAGARGPACGESPVDFDTQIIPLLTRQSCNAGACHGAAAGRGGFKLSLFGSDPAADHEALVHDLEGRRVNLVDPELSLLVRKATETIQHGGGVRLQPGSDGYELLLRWLNQGARRWKLRRLTHLRVTPDQVLLDEPGDAVNLSVSARFDDGEVKDVTNWTVLAPDDPASLEVASDPMRLVVKRPGEYVVVARFLDQIRTIRVGVPLGPPRDGAALPRPARLVDRHVDSKMAALGIPASPQADDYEFARRVWLDLAGRLPTADELQSFVDDSAAGKRTRLIDRLLASNDFADTWALQWAGVLAIDSGRLAAEGAAAYHRWLAKQLRDDAPWNEVASQLVTATGDAFEVGPANFARSASGPDGLAEYASRVLMGVRLRCANCHDHPLDHWRQDDYHGLAAIFAKVRQGRVVSISDRGEVTHPVTGEAATPRIPGRRDLADSADGRIALADWLARTDNPYLARAAVNRVWSQLMGRGLVEPVDDIRDTNPASHPELLRALSEDFVEHGFRFKHLIRRICTSNAYQRSGRRLAENAADLTYYSHALRRPLEAEVIADAIATVTGVRLAVGEAPVDRAIRLTDNRLPSRSLDVLGRCDRSMPCEAPASDSGALRPVLHFLNGDLLNRPVSADAAALTRLIAENEDDLSIIRSLYMRSLSRPLYGNERDYWINELRQTRRAAGEDWGWESRRRFHEDVLWGLLASESFRTNH